MQNLVNLRHLDVSETGLEEMPKKMSELKDLQFLSSYIVGKHEENGVGELGELAHLHGSLWIEKLENVKNSGEASNARMDEKIHLNTLYLWWSTFEESEVCDSQSEKDVLDKLRPHKDLKKLSISCYRDEMPRKMSKLKDLQFLSCYIAGKHEENGIGELRELTHLHGSLRIEKLENVKNSGEASNARMDEKIHLTTLYLSWSSFEESEDCDSQSEKDVLDKLCPHKDLKKLVIRRYRGQRIPSNASLQDVSRVKYLHACIGATLDTFSYEIFVDI
ncbi:hypothetical protein AHAS_Ahas02G0247900 [Arachis hypogaea]